MVVGSVSLAIYRSSHGGKVRPRRDRWLAAMQWQDVAKLFLLSQKCLEISKLGYATTNFISF